MLNKLLLMTLLSTLAGCASIKDVPVDVGYIKQTAPSSIAQTNRVRSDFLVMKPGTSLLGVFGYSVAKNIGDPIVTSNKIADPSEAIAAEVTALLSKQYGLRVHEREQQIVSSSEPSVIAEQYQGTDLVVDVDTYVWSIHHLSGDATHYALHYTAKLKIVDTRENTLVAEGFCASLPSDEDEKKSYAVLVGNGAEGLKQEIAAAVSLCVDDFKQNVLLL